jgi:hypothetical protein
MRNSALGGREWIAFGKRNNFCNGKRVVCAGKNMRTSHAVFLKLTTATTPILILMTGLNLDRIGSNAQSFNQAILWYGYVVHREHKQEKCNEFGRAVRHDCSNCSLPAPAGLHSTVANCCLNFEPRFCFVGTKMD